jgi:hypothetical protein
MVKSQRRLISDIPVFVRSGSSSEPEKNTTVSSNDFKSENYSLDKGAYRRSLERQIEEAKKK